MPTGPHELAEGRRNEVLEQLVDGEDRQAEIKRARELAMLISAHQADYEPSPLDRGVKRKPKVHKRV